MKMTTYLRDVMNEQFKRKIELERKLESKMKFLSSTANKSVGLNGKLIDEEGYPRSDIDIKAVCQARQDFHRAMNDFKELMKDIDKNLIKLHMNYRSSNSENQDEDSDSLNNIEVPSTSDALFAHIYSDFCRETQIFPRNDSELEIDLLPSTSGALSSLPNSASLTTHHQLTTNTNAIFYVTNVEQNTPASQAGFQAGDLILSFSHFNTLNFHNIDQIRSYLQNSDDLTFECELSRNEEIMNLIISRETKEQSLGLTVESYTPV